jgi:putative ABC transport system permease protein
MLDDLFFRLRSLFRRGAVESELDDELRFHAERQLEKYVRSGMTRDAARRQIRLDFGGLDQVKDDCRDARGVSLVETLAQDLRYGWRTLRKSPGFAAAALLTLALGIGVSSATFSVVYAFLLRPLPFHDASRLVLLNETTPMVGNVSVSYPNFQDWRAQSRTFSAMAAITGLQFNMAGAGKPESIGGIAVSPAFFSLAGVQPVVGRAFAPDEEKPGAAPVVLLSYALWQSRFGADPNAVGRTIRLDGSAFTVVGILPANFRWLDRCDVMEPIGVWATHNGNYANRQNRGDLRVIGRLAPGATLDRARAEMEGIAAALARAYPDANDQFGIRLQPLREAFSGDVQSAILVLLAAAVFVLLIACANVGNLFVMRALGRGREMALRIAIGAGRGRIIRQIVTESFLVGVLGGVAGVALAVAATPAVARAIPADTLAGAAVEVSGPVLLFSAALVLLSVLLFGLAPAFHCARGDLQSQLKESVRATSGTAGNRWRGILAAAEIALALVLLAGAGLMLKSLYRLLSVDSGFRADRVLTLEIDLRAAQYDKDPAVIAFWQQTLDGVRALPGVESAALGTAIPLTDFHARTDITVEGMPQPKPGSYPHPDLHTVSPDYEKALGIRLLRGRAFADADRENAPRVAMVNATVAQRLFPGADPVGKRFAFGRVTAGRPPKWVTIVGVVADTRMYGLDNPARLEVYLPFRQFTDGQMTLLVKSSRDPAALTSAIRAVVASIDKDQPIFHIASMREVVNASIFTRRVTLILLGLFSALALVLASIGIYGVVSYSIAQRSREIGIRIALGAQRRDVFRLALAQGARISAAGIAVGVLAALALTRFLAGLLYSVSAFDPVTFAAVALLLIAIALAACLIPARRTLRVDPLIVLRHE